MSNIYSIGLILEQKGLNKDIVNIVIDYTFSPIDLFNYGVTNFYEPFLYEIKMEKKDRKRYNFYSKYFCPICCVLFKNLRKQHLHTNMHINGTHKFFNEELYVYDDIFDKICSEFFYEYKRYPKKKLTFSKKEIK